MASLYKLRIPKNKNALPKSSPFLKGDREGFLDIELPSIPLFQRGMPVPRTSWLQASSLEKGRLERDLLSTRQIPLDFPERPCYLDVENGDGWLKPPSPPEKKGNNTKTIMNNSASLIKQINSITIQFSRENKNNYKTIPASEFNIKLETILASFSHKLNPFSGKNCIESIQFNSLLRPTRPWADYRVA